MRKATRRETTVAMIHSMSIISKIRKSLRKKGYRFVDDVVGSRKYNTILVNKGEPYDIDVRLILTHNCRETNAQKVFEDFKTAFTSLKTKSMEIDFGTQAIKCSIYNQNHLTYILEYVIVYNGSILRLNKTQEKRHWHQMKEKYEYAYERFNNLSSYDKMVAIEEYILPLKLNARNSNSDKSSVALFVEGLNKFERDMENA